MAEKQSPTSEPADPEGIIQTWGTLLVEARIRAGLTQVDLANLCPTVDQRMISQYENGHVTPEVSSQMQLASALKVQVSILFPRSPLEGEGVLRVRKGRVIR